MCGLVRLYAYRQGVTNVFDFPRDEAKTARRRLEGEGWVVYHTVEV